MRCVIEIALRTIADFKITLQGTSVYGIFLSNCLCAGKIVDFSSKIFARILSRENALFLKSFLIILIYFTRSLILKNIYYLVLTNDCFTLFNICIDTFINKFLISTQ